MSRNLRTAHTWAFRLALIFAGFAVAILLIEGVLTAFLMVKHGKVGREELTNKRERLRDDVIGGTGNRYENRLVLHPLFGYTYNPNDQGINNFGFPAGHDVVLDHAKYSTAIDPKRNPLVIGILGGSFAEILGKEREYLEDKLKPIFPDRTPVVMNFAVGGYALPQSAFVYVYFKEVFDVVIFVDGLNEVWNYVQNNKMGFPPEYAKAVHYIYKISRQDLTPVQFEKTAHIVSLKRKIDGMTSLSLLPVIRQSLVVHYMWKALQGYWSRQVSALSLEIEDSYKSKKVFFDTDDEVMFTFAAHQWVKYHKLIHDLSSSEGALSIHLLQPNPFVPHSKSLTSEEKSLIAQSYPIEEYVVNGYPKLRTEISNLRAQGLIVEDLTDVFKGIDAPIWIDAAHTNEKGSRLIMDQIVELIRNKKETVRPASH